MIQKLIHSSLHLSHLPAARRFVHGRDHLEQTQRAALHEYLKRTERTTYGQNLNVKSEWSWEEFSNQVAVSSYSAYEIWIQKQKLVPQDSVLVNRVRRFEPTSGSTSKRKWIPYSDKLLQEFNEAASVWLFDLARTFPKVMSGRHYWSLSYLPQDLRDQKLNTDDVEIFSWLKRLVFRRLMALPSDLGLLPDAESCRIATLAHLAAATDLSLISVWSPTYLLEMLKDFYKYKDELIEILENARWTRAGLEVSELECPRSQRAASILRRASLSEFSFVNQLWPKLALISAWESSHSHWWAKQIKDLFPQVGFQGKGLWATEGVVSIPFQGAKPLAYTSHFYEFRCLSSGKILPAWKLQADQVVQPILTTGSGFLRYELPDQVRVTGFYGQVPCLEFLGRINSIDLVGEKMDAPLAIELLSKMSEQFKIPFLSLMADMSSSRPRYVFLAQSESQSDDASSQRKMEEQGERLLQSIHHYRVARELNQLDAAKVFLKKDAFDFYKQVSGRSFIEGDIKIEPLISLVSNRGLA